MLFLNFFQFLCFLITISSYEIHRKSLGNHPICTNILPTLEFQSLYIAPRRSPEIFLQPTLNMTSPYASLPCDSITIHGHDIDIVNLASLLDKGDHDDSIRRIIFHTSITSINQNEIQQINEKIDQVITSRPWWRVQEHENHDNLLIYIDRVAREWESHIRFIGSIQYPPPEICHETPIILSKEDCTHPGWGAVFGMYGNLYRSFPYVIVAPYVSISNDPLENTAFIKGSDCPNELNKWHCAFLPATNCSIPSIVSECRGDHCVPGLTYGSGIVLTHADRDGKVIDLMKEGDEVRLQYQTEIHSPLSKRLAAKQAFIHPQYKYIMPYNRTWYEIAKDDVHDAYAEYATYGHYILLRMNSWYRAQVSHYIRSYRASTNPYFHQNDDCVAVHIRRGDRSTQYSMNEICYNATHEPKQCLDDFGGLRHCNVQDMYCGFVPFGSIEFPRTLQSIGQILPPIEDDKPRNILLFSDDYDWIQQETEAIKNDPTSPYHHWNFYHPPPPSTLTEKKQNNYQKYHMIRSEGGTASGIYLQATFQMISQCSAFVGHFGSSFTGLLYAIMCHRHRGLEGYCPPMFDVKWDHEYYDKKYEEYVKEREARASS